MNPGGQFPLLALARDESGTIAFQYMKPNSATSGGSVELSGTWSTVGTETMSMTGLSDTDFPYAIYTEVASGVPYSQTNLSPAAVDAGARSASFETHPGYADFIQTELSLQQLSSGRGTVTAIATRATPPALSGSTSVDFSQLLPRITGVTLDSSDLTRPSVTWTSAAPLSSAAGTFTEMSWSTEEDGGSTQFGTWTIVAPSTATTVTAPALPSSLASSLVPGSNATWNDVPTVAAVAGGGFVDYTALRSTAGALAAQLDPTDQPLIMPLAANGSMQITMSYQDLDNE